MRNCLVCGKEFEVCNTCNRNVDEMLQWRRVTCCAEHFQYHLPIIQYIRQTITKDQAKADLQSAIDAYGEIEFSDNIKPVIAEIFADSDKGKKKRSRKNEK